MAIWRTCRRPYDGAVIHQGAPGFLRCIRVAAAAAPPPRTPALGPDAAYSSTQHALDVGAVRRESTGTSAWPSGPRAPRLRPHDSMSCSRRGAHRTPPVELISPRPFPVPGGVGVGGAGPRGRFRWKASQPRADRIALPGVGWWCAARQQAFPSHRLLTTGLEERTGEAARGRVAARRAHGPGRNAARGGRDTFEASHVRATRLRLPGQRYPGQADETGDWSSIPPHDLHCLCIVFLRPAPHAVHDRAAAAGHPCSPRPTPNLSLSPPCMHRRLVAHSPPRVFSLCWSPKTCSLFAAACCGCGCGFYSIFLSMDCSCSNPNSCNSVGL
jgi:hypothetical protein